jgi:flagellin-like protein
MKSNMNRMKSRWGKKSKRGVSPIIATILLVAITVVLAAVLYILISGLTKGPGNTPIGTALAVGGLTESTSGANFIYTTTIQSPAASAGMTWSNMLYQVQSAAGVVIAAGPVNVTVTNPTLGGCSSALFVFSTSTWAAFAGNGKCTSGTLGGSALVSTGAQITLLSTVNLNGQGDKIVVIGQGTYSGTDPISIP